MMDLVGKSGEDIEEMYGFDFYLETKDDLLSIKRVDFRGLVDSFLDFNKERDLKVIKLYDGVIQDVVEMNLSEIKKNLLLLVEDNGAFYDDSDDELATCYGFLCDDYFAEIMPSIIFFSGKEECVNSFACVLREKNLEFHEPEKISGLKDDMVILDKRLQKLGRNEPCHCGSGKKYKKCCLDKDIKEIGKPRKVGSLWDEGYFAESLSPEEAKEKEKTICMGHDVDMRFECKRCGAKISAHNKDWHACMCDVCFNKEFHKNTES